MSIKSIVVATLAAGTLLAAAAPAQAVITTFANFSAIGSGANVRWVNNGTTASNGTGGLLYTTATASSTAPGTRAVRFSFLQASIAPFVTNATAAFTLNASVVDSPATLVGGNFLIQSVTSGTFSFLSTSAITIGSKTFAAGSNFLSASFNQSTIFGQRAGSSGSFSASTPGGSTITYTSDFLDFTSTVERDFSLSLTSITSVLQATPTNGVPTRALRSFRALSTGSFSSDPAPIVTAIPEPAVWGLMIVGFGMVGLQTRRRLRNTTVAA